MDFLEAWCYERPPLSLVLGPRGGGKSYLAALATHVDSIRYDAHGTLVLGGSEAQSRQIYQALKDFREPLGDYEPITQLAATRATYCTESFVEYIAASSKSVRGPHVPTLRLDEVDEMDPDIRESSFGMSMAIDGIPASITMTSTWHKVGGPMRGLLESGDNGAYPVYRFCVWEVLERCPDERSGRALENCPDCPLMTWCHADIDGHGQGLPKAKRSNGHYAIDSLIQKVRGVSKRVFESDYLCIGPKPDGVWFVGFSPDVHVTEAAEYDPALAVHCSVDSGVRAGAVLFQVRDGRVNVFADYFREFFDGDLGAEATARDVLDLIGSRCGHAQSAGQLRVSTDSAGGSRNPVGPTVLAEYERAGLRGPHGLECWPKYAGSVTDQLALLEALLRSADGRVSLTIHPRCTALIESFRGYARKKSAGVWLDVPADEQHPHEEMIDALRGGLKVEMPDGRRPQPALRRYPAGRIF
jgi:hypothetical protein